VSAIRVIYTKSGEFYYRYFHRFSTISFIIDIYELSFVTACGNSYTKSILITYKSSYKQILYFGLPSVSRKSRVQIGRGTATATATATIHKERWLQHAHFLELEEASARRPLLHGTHYDAATGGLRHLRNSNVKIFTLCITASKWIALGCRLAMWTLVQAIWVRLMDLSSTVLQLLSTTSPTSRSHIVLQVRLCYNSWSSQCCYTSINSKSDVTVVYVFAVSICSRLLTVHPVSWSAFFWGTRVLGCYDGQTHL